jgi:hypothetical protein
LRPDRSLRWPRLVAVAMTALAVVTACSDDASSGPVYPITGTVEAGPTCPVERPGQVCPPAPVKGTVMVIQHGKNVAITQTDAAGHFTVSLTSGDYQITVDSGAVMPRCEPVALHVTDRPVDLQIQCDTGIR